MTSESRIRPGVKARVVCSACAVMLLWLTNQLATANDGAAFDRVRAQLSEMGYGTGDLALVEATSEMRPLGRRVTARYVRTDGTDQELFVVARRALAFSSWQIRELALGAVAPAADDR